VPPENRVGCDDRRDLTEPATAHPVSMHGHPTAFFIGEADPATEARAEDAVFLNQIRDARLPLVGPPASHGHHEESNRSDIHDGGSLPHPLNVELENASAEKWDTTAVQPARCTRRLPISMKNSTYNRWNQTVSTVKKSTAITLFACARRNSRHGGSRRLPAGPSCSSRRTFLTRYFETKLCPDNIGTENVLSMRCRGPLSLVYVQDEEDIYVGLLAFIQRGANCDSSAAFTWTRNATFPFQLLCLRFLRHRVLIDSATRPSSAKWSPHLSGNKEQTLTGSLLFAAAQAVDGEVRGSEHRGQRPLK